MPNTLTTFSFANLQVEIDGTPIEGFWEGDDAVQIEQNKDDGFPVVGADGCATVSRPVDQSVIITLRLKPNCTGHRLLTNKKIAIDNNAVQDFSINIRDAGNGEGGMSAFATVIGAPSPQFGENASAREWRIFANDFRYHSVSYSL